ncbi:unnamed protein product, partial [Mesocestoides corti]
SEIKQFFKPVRIKDAKILKRGVAVVYFKSQEDLNTSLQKHGDIHGSTVAICPYENDLFFEAPKSGNDKPTWDSVPVDQLRNEIKEARSFFTGRLFLRNLSYDCTEADLLELFSPFGTVSEVHLSYDPILRRSRGFAFVTFLFPADAVSAFNKLDKQKFKNRLLHILPGKENKSHPKHLQKTTLEESAPPVDEDGDQATMSEFQKNKLAELKATSSVSHNWNTLFINPDAVSTYLAAKFGVSKEQILDSTGKESAAVRLAHGEAQLVHEIREFLLREGVRLDLLERETPSRRRDKLESQAASTHRQLSGTAFIIKNLPVATSEPEVRDLIHRLTRSGAQQLETPRRVILPPLGITAIVEYAVPQIARLAYKALSYEPYKDNVLFLQWAPDGILSPKPKVTEKETGEGDAGNDDVGDEGEAVQPSDTTTVATMKRKKSKKWVQHRDGSSEQPEEATHNFADLISTENADDAEADVFEAVAPSASEREATSKRSKKRQRTDQDEEFAIVKKPARSASTNFKQDSEDSESVAEKSVGTATVTPAKATTDVKRNRVILVRNVAFQASRSELTALFKPIGGLVKVRMPQKPSGGHRGFAFVEFATEDQAESAINSFGVDTHLFGRRLNIEYAKAV